MNSTLYIDGLLASVGEQQLKGMFSAFGNVLSVDVYPPNMALSSGIGTVEMASQGDAAKAISALHRSYLGWKTAPRVPRSRCYRDLAARRNVSGTCRTIASVGARS